MWQTYLTPTTLDETLRLLAQHGKEGRQAVASPARAPARYRGAGADC